MHQSPSRAWMPRAASASASARANAHALPRQAQLGPGERQEAGGDPRQRHERPRHHHRRDGGRGLDAPARSPPPPAHGAIAPAHCPAASLPPGTRRRASLFPTAGRLPPPRAAPPRLYGTCLKRAGCVRVMSGVFCNWLRPCCRAVSGHGWRVDIGVRRSGHARPSAGGLPHRLALVLLE